MGQKCWIQVEKGNKLGGCVYEGRWVGVDDESKGARIYWQDTKTVTVEFNIYFDPTSASVDRLEGGDWQFVKMTTDKLTSKSPSPSSTVVTPPQQPEPTHEHLRKANHALGILASPANVSLKFFLGMP